MKKTAKTDHKGISKDKIKYFNERLAVIKDDENIIAFPEIHVSDQQLEIMADPMFGWTKEFLKDYFRKKIHGEILQMQTPYTTREEQPDFQYIFDLGVKALAAGMTL